MIYFRTEEAARAFAAKNAKYEFIDFGDGPEVENGHRYAVRVISKK